ncbi:hypothetical protein ACWD4F_39480 [Streptomyces aureus]
MTDPDRAGGSDPCHDDPYERGKFDQASCGWVALGVFVLFMLLYMLLLFAPDNLD